MCQKGGREKQPPEAMGFRGRQDFEGHQTQPRNFMVSATRSTATM